ncbi:MAG: TlyA family RNA methyltransferase [Bacillota bacterium]
MAKERLDKVVTNRGLFPSRSKAKRAIMAGMIIVDNELVDKAGTQVDEEAEIKIKGDPCPYVSRGGYKLEKCLEEFEIDLTNQVVIDIGASTGGFTDCALQNGAQQVYAVDVGYGQLAWKLRQDDRVVNHERTNARYLTSADFETEFAVATIDVAFISLTKILPAVVDLLAADGEILALIKPQFEAGPKQVNSNGVVKDSAVHKQVIKKVVKAGQEEGLSLVDLSFSPITGAQGHNIEYLSHFKLAAEPISDQNLSSQVAQVVNQAHQELK